MNKENASKLWKMIQETGDYLHGLRTTIHESKIRDRGQKIGRTHQYTSVIFQGRKSNNRPPLGQAQNLFKLTKHQ